MSEVVVVNIHGGFPSAMVDKALCELPGFSRLASLAEVNDRVYPTNACAGPTLHDTFMDAPMASMTDSVWHPWAFSRRASRTLFHVFKQANYNTRLFGAFGLDARLDPHTHMHFQPANLHAALQAYGIDVCDAQDAAFTCQLGFAHDKDVLRRVVEHLGHAADVDRLTVVNLLGCQDAHKCTFRDVDPEKVAIPVMNLNQTHTDAAAHDDRCFAANVVDDDVRKTGAPANGIDALRRSAALKDWVRGCAGTSERQEVIRVVNGLHRFCWKCLQEIDRGICEILDSLERGNRLDDAIVYLYSDHPISLFEHGETCEAPWEACLRSFMIRKGRKCSTSTRSSAPFSIARLPSMLLRDAGILAAWHTAPPPSDCCVTLGLACSWLVRARMEPQIEVTQLRTFFIRVLILYNSRPYAFTFWFGLLDLLPDASSPKECPWPNPVLHASLPDFAARGALQVYEHTSDPYELNNLAHCPLWLAGEAATRIKPIIDAELHALKLRELHFKIPEQVSALSVEHVSFCSVQLHHRVRERMRAGGTAPLLAPRLNMRHAETQTDEVTLHDALSTTYGSSVCHLIKSRLPDVTTDVPLTIFVPYGDVDAEEWHAWAPRPLRGAYSKDAMRNVAEHGISVTDAVTGLTHVPTGFDAENVFFKSCRVLLKSAVNIFHSGGLVVGYRVIRDAQEVRLAFEAAPPPQEPVIRLERPSPRSLDVSAQSARGVSKAAEIRARSANAPISSARTDPTPIGLGLGARPVPTLAATLEIEEAASPRAPLFRGKNLVSQPLRITSSTAAHAPAIAKATITRSNSASRKSVRAMEQTLQRQR